MNFGMNYALDFGDLHTRGEDKNCEDKVTYGDISQ
jgi:hypothetical protein